MTTFCLIHGSGQGPAGWQLLVDELARHGHGALTPAFHIDRTDEGAAWHAETIVEALERSGLEPADTILVAHSAAGMYLPLIADRFGPRRMVFLAAFVPRPGMSVLDQVRADPTLFNPDWIGQNPADDRVAIDFVFHDCPPERIEWAMSTRVFFYAKRAIEEPCPLAEWPRVPASYIACADDRTITPGWQQRAARELLGVEPIVMPGGHAPHVTRPELLAEVLTQIAG